MEANNRKGIISLIVIIFGLLVGSIIGLNHYTSQKTYEQITEAYQEVDKSMAIKTLSELRGRLLEVESLSHEDLPEGLLLEELDKITAPKHFTNEYLKDFSFAVSATSNVRELCGELISQIDDQIHVIEYGTKGE